MSDSEVVQFSVNFPGFGCEVGRAGEETAWVSSRSSRGTPTYEPLFGDRPSGVESRLEVCEYVELRAEVVGVIW